MGRRRHHYELAFEHYLRLRSLPFVSVNEARRALVAESAPLRVGVGSNGDAQSRTLKSFDFVIYGEPSNLLVEVKGRQVTGVTSSGKGRMECWVTEQDVESLLIWERLFGSSFTAAFVFIYWCHEQPPEPLFEEIFEFRDRWYALRGIDVRTYAREMRRRSPKWGTVHLPHAVFDRLSGSLLGPTFTRPLSEVSISP